MQVLGHRLRWPRKQAVGFQVDGVHPATQAFEQLWHHRTARSTYRIERDTEAAAPDRLHIHAPQREHAGEMAGNRVRIHLHGADDVVIRPWQGIPGRQLADPSARCCIKKDAIRADELESVPFDGIVAGGEHDAASSPMMLHRKLYRRCGNKAHIDYIAADGLEAGGCRGREHWSRGARVSPQNDRRPGGTAAGRPLAVTRPRSKRRRPAGDDFGSQVRTDETSHPRHTDHQGVGHRTINVMNESGAACFHGASRKP